MYCKYPARPMPVLLLCSSRFIRLSDITPTRRIHDCYTSHERVPATPPPLETNGGTVSLDESDHIAPCFLLHNNQAAHSYPDFALQLSSGQTFEKLALGPGCTTSQPPSHPARQQDFRTSIPQRVGTPISRWHTASRTLHFMPKLSQTIAPPAAPPLRNNFHQTPRTMQVLASL